MLFNLKKKCTCRRKMILVWETAYDDRFLLHFKSGFCTMWLFINVRFKFHFLRYSMCSDEKKMIIR